MKRIGSFRGMPLFVAPPHVRFDGQDLLKMEPRGPDRPGEQGPILDGWIATAKVAAKMLARGLVEP